MRAQKVIESENGTSSQKVPSFVDEVVSQTRRPAKGQGCVSYLRGPDAGRYRFIDLHKNPNEGSFLRLLLWSSIGDMVDAQLSPNVRVQKHES